MRTALISWIHGFRAIAAELGPYLVAALIVPGGTLVALLWWLHRHRRSARALADARSTGKPPPPRASASTATPAARQSTAWAQTTYTPAIANAKAWLGDRYLLAHPIYPHTPSGRVGLQAGSDREPADVEHA